MERGRSAKTGRRGVVVCMAARKGSNNNNRNNEDDQSWGSIFNKIGTRPEKGREGGREGCALVDRHTPTYGCR